jgi:hypothetical protein
MKGALVQSYRIIVAVMYLGAIGVALGVRMLWNTPLGNVPSSVGPLLLLVAVVDYGLSLWIEHRMLRPASWTKTGPGQPLTPEGRVGAAAVISGTVGVAPAIYAALAHALGEPGAVWFWPIFGIAVLAFAHHMTRWERYEEALRRWPRP